MMRRVRTRGISEFLDAHDAERLRMALLARRAWGDWLNAYLWDHFVTLTFRVPTSGDAAVHAFGVFKRRLEQRAQQKIHWFRVLERGAAGLLHVHALLAGTQTLATSAVANAWHRGRSDVSVCDPARGASYYVTKTIWLTEADYDFTLPAPPRGHPMTLLRLPSTACDEHQEYRNRPLNNGSQLPARLWRPTR